MSARNQAATQLLWPPTRQLMIITGREFSMGEVIRLAEIDYERRRIRARVAERADLERAVSILGENLAAAADALREAPMNGRAELLDRIEKLTAMMRYGLRMLGVSSPDLPRESDGVAGGR
jgi:hypothetical protein